MIELQNFTKHYRNKVAVDRLTLKIGPGEIFGFIGPNGAGKTTTIRFLATLIRATEGEGWVAGHNVRRDPLAVKRSLGYMPDSFGVYNGMRVKDFLEFFAAIHRLPATKRKKAIAEVTDRLELAPRWNDYVNYLSRGLKQRLCLAQALLHDPPVLILDEPASGLDPRARIQLKQLLGELRQRGKCILISSHILAELADCCTSIGIIEGGQLLISGPLEEVIKQVRPVRRVVIRFVDSVEKGLNVLRGIADVQTLEIQQNELHVALRAQDRDLAAIMKQLVTAGASICSFAEEEPSLEEVFLVATQSGKDGRIVDSVLADQEGRIPAWCDRRAPQNEQE